MDQTCLDEWNLYSFTFLLPDRWHTHTMSVFPLPPPHPLSTLVIPFFRSGSLFSRVSTQHESLLNLLYLSYFVRESSVTLLSYSIFPSTVSILLKGFYYILFIYISFIVFCTNFYLNYCLLFRTLLRHLLLKIFVPKLIKDFPIYILIAL